MKIMVKLILILISITNIYLPLKPEEHFDIQINKDGWELPKLDEFTSTRGKQECGELYKNCYSEGYVPKGKINFPKIFINKTIYNGMNCFEICSEEWDITGLSIVYYKNQPFCYFLGGKEVFKEEGYTAPSFLALLDMDLDGKFELMLGSSEVIEFFLKFSLKVDEDDRYKGSLYIDGKEIK